MKTITLNDNHIAHLNAKNTTKLEYLNLSNNNLLPTNDIAYSFQDVKELLFLLFLPDMFYWCAS